MQRARNGGPTAPAVGRQIVDFKFALAAEAADNVDFPAHLGHRHLGAGGGHWGADGPTANVLGEGRGSAQGTAGQQPAAEQRDELAPSIKKMTGHGTAAEGLISSPPVVSFKAIFVSACSPTFRADLPPQR